MNALWRFAWLALRGFSGVNRWFLRRFTPAGRVAVGAVVAAGVFGIDTERSTVYQMFTLVAAMLAFAWLATLRWSPRARVRRVLPRVATAGEPLRYRIELGSQGRRPLQGVLVTDQLADPRPDFARFLASGPPPYARSWVARSSGYLRWRWLVGRAAQADAATRPLADVRAGDEVEIPCSLTPRRRGVLRFEAVTLARSDPFGLMNACHDLAAPSEVLVLPKRYRLPDFALVGGRRHQPGGVAFAGSIGDSEEFLALREYRPGDPLQRVHWKSYARLGEPVVKEFQDEFFQRHALVLDTCAGPDRAEAFEEAVSVAASFASRVDTHDCLLDLVFVGARPHVVTAGRGLLSAGGLLEVLACAQLATAGELGALEQALRGHADAISGAILVLLAWDDGRRAMVESLRARGVAVTVLVIGDDDTREVSEPAGVRVLSPGRIEQDLARGLA